MNRRLRSALCAVWCISSLGCTTGTLGSIGVRADGGYFRPELSANIQVDDDGIIGTDIDLEAVADLPSRGNSPFGALSFTLSGLTLHLSGWGTSMTGDTILTSALTFNGETFVIGEELDTDLEVINGSATLEISLLPLETLHVGVGLGVDVFYVDLELQQLSVNISERYEEIVPLPVVSATVEFTPTRYLTFFAHAQGIYADTGWVGLDDEVSGRIKLLDLWAGVRGTWTSVYATAGVKWLFLDGGIKDAASIDVDFVGFLVTVGVEF